MLMTYGAQPSSAVLVVPGVTQAPSTNPAAHTTSATAASGTATGPTSSSSTSSSSNSISSSSSSTSSSDITNSSYGLSTGAKAGIGVGVGGGACLLGAVALIAFFWGKRQKKRKSDTAQEAQQPGTPYSGGGVPPM
ncbi:hypothetical protein B0A55_01908 [Friedmanniomyces simplex]|uniref:Mid2 domain-containing protein n=1 Tax=Friedmanniomyces simplex TaxID=329884 RepID=A0A4U0XS07_9PEZI|nr:hypothetical protein B0A55_01908 [Friedmanniomyces simplex]